MKKMLFLLLVVMVTLPAFSTTMNLKDVYVGWFRPSAINTWTTPWMLPVLYNESTNTTFFSAYYRGGSGPDTLSAAGVYAFRRFIGVDYMHATLDASYTRFTFDKYTIGIAVPNAGFDVRYVSAMDGKQNYYDEIGMDIEFVYDWSIFNIFSPVETNPNSTLFSYVKLFNLVRYVKQSYPEGSTWKTVFSFDYLIRTVWILPQFALIYDDFNGVDDLSHPADYNAIELLFKPVDALILRGGVSFENTASYAAPSFNVGVRYEFKNFFLNADYQHVIAEPNMTFAVSCGANF